MSLPEIRIFSYDTAEIASPSGTRNIAGGSFAFNYRVASGCQMPNPLLPNSTSGTLLFENLIFNATEDNSNISDHFESKVACITFNLASSGQAISDMRLFLRKDSALAASTWYGLNSGFVQMSTSGVWAYNGILPSGAGTRLTTNYPIQSNIFRQDGKNGLFGQDDQNSSQFVYMNVVLPNGFPVGTYGICGSGVLRFGFLFDYFNNDYILQFGNLF